MMQFLGLIEVKLASARGNIFWLVQIHRHVVVSVSFAWAVELLILTQVRESRIRLATSTWGFVPKTLHLVELISTVHYVALTVLQVALKGLFFAAQWAQRSLTVSLW